MRSVADLLRAELRDRVAQMDPLARVHLALRLGDDDATLFARARGIALADARRLMTRSRQIGREPSACHDHLHDAPRTRIHPPG